MERRLKVRMHPFELTHINYTIGPNFQVACSGSLRYAPKYRAIMHRSKQYPKYFWPVSVKVESPYGFNGKANKIKGSKQAKYAIQILMEACSPCTLIT